MSRRVRVNPMFQLGFRPEALDDLRQYRKVDQQKIIQAIEDQLPHQADQVTRNRKRLRPNNLASWEMRVGDFRVFYDIAIDGTQVQIVAIGEKKGSKLFVHGAEYAL